MAADPGNAGAVKELNQAESQLGGALGRLFALSEAYPDLKANQNMLSLQEELTSTENKIGFARQAFNDSATAYNNQRQVFPAVLVASTLGFPDRLRTFDFDPSDLTSPVARLQALIRKLQPHAAYTRAVAFAKEGQ